MSWGDGFDDPDEADRIHRAFAGYVWDELMDVLGERLDIAALRYVGPAACHHGECDSTTCSTQWDVVDATGLTHVVVVPT